MRQKHILSLILAGAMLFVLLSGCGAKTAHRDEQDMEYRSNAMAAGDAAPDIAVDPMTLPENRKWVITLDISAEAEDLDASLAAVSEQVQALDGYVEDQSRHNGSSSSAYRYRSAEWTIRIPADRESEFMAAMDKSANVVSSNRSVEDITLTYVDTESRLQALETEEARLLELLSQAETMSDLLEIESRLTDVQYEKESYASRLRRFDNQVDYATIHLSMQEVKEYTPTEELTLWQRISTGFMDSLRGLGDGIVEISALFLIYLPYIAVIGLIVFLLIFFIRRAEKKSAARREAMLHQMPPQVPPQAPPKDQQ